MNQFQVLFMDLLSDFRCYRVFSTMKNKCCAIFCPTILKYLAFRRNKRFRSSRQLWFAVGAVVGVFIWYLNDVEVHVLESPRLVTCLHPLLDISLHPAGKL